MDLNDAVRFRQPAMYRIYVLSRRVRQVLDSAGTEPRFLLDSHSSPVELVSNIPTPEVRSAPEAWVKDRIDSALRTLRDPGSNISERTAARRELLFLNTREAAIELANHLGEDAIDPALAYSDYRKDMLAVMEQRLVAPDQPVPANYLDTLAAMAVLERPGGDPKRVGEVRGQKRNEYATKVFAEGMPKQPGAGAVSVSTLLETGTRMGRPEPWVRGIAAWVTANFRSLPDYVQYRLLAGSAWQVLKGLLMVPVLREVCDSPSPAYPLAYQAVHNLFEIAPNDGRAAIVADIRRPKGNFQFNWLAELPIGALPEADEALVARAEPGDWYSDNRPLRNRRHCARGRRCIHEARRTVSELHFACAVLHSPPRSRFRPPRLPPPP